MVVQRVPVLLSNIIMKEYTFTLTEQEANIVLAGLQELPARISNPLTQKLQEQAKTQLEQVQAE